MIGGQLAATRDGALAPVTMAHQSPARMETKDAADASALGAEQKARQEASPAPSSIQLRKWAPDEPYALEPSLGCLVIHINGLAAHTGNLQARPDVSVLVMRAEEAGQPVHALPRVTLNGLASVLEAASPAWEACRAAYVERFPEAKFMTQLGDFRFVAIGLNAARQVAGFGAARSIDAEVRYALGLTGQ